MSITTLVLAGGPAPEFSSAALDAAHPRIDFCDWRDGMLLVGWLKLFCRRVWEYNCRRGRGLGKRRRKSRLHFRAEACEPRLLMWADAVNDSATTLKNQMVEIELTGNDSFEGYITDLTVTQPSHGTVEIRPDVSSSVWNEWEYWGHEYYSTFTAFYQNWYYEPPENLTWYAYYTPNSNYTGSDSFTYSIADIYDGYDTATVSVTVTPPGNEAATVSLANKVTSLSEGASTGARRKMADIVVTDDGLGTNTLALTGTNASLFEIYDGDLYLKSGVTLSHTSQPTLGVNVTVDDTTVGGSPDSTASLSVSITAAVDAVNDSVTVNHNQAKTIHILSNDVGTGLSITSLTQPSHGTVELRPDVDSYTWSDWIEYGQYDFATFEEYYEYWYEPSENLVWTAYYTPTTGYSGSDSFTYTISDGTHTDTATVNLTVQTPVNNPPNVSLTNKVTSLAENTSTASRIKMADIVITDDGLGTNTLALTGTNAALFEIYDGDLYLKSGTTLNYEALTSLAVTVTINDTTVGGNPDGSAGLTTAITNVNDVAPTLALTSPRTTPLPEDSFFAVRFKVATVVVTDDGLGTNTLSLTGADADLFEVDHTGLYIKAGAALDYTGNAQLDVTVNVDDATHGSGVDDSENYSLQVSNANRPPSLSFANVVTSLDEDADTTSATFIADLVVDDDETSGTLAYTLSGVDAEHFQVVGGQLFLKAGTDLDHETVAALRVAVGVDDTSLGAGVEDVAPLKLLINNVNDVAPVVALANTFTSSLSEDAAIPPRFQVAEIRITDDGAGTNTLTLSGADAALFEIVGDTLVLKADAVLDFETNPVLNVTVNVDDAEFGSGVDDSESYALAITDANDAPVVSLDDVVDELPEDTDLTTALPVADIVITDDAQSDPVITLTGPDQDLFEVVAGVLRLKAGAALDHDIRPQLSVTVMVHDPDAAGPNSTATLTIDVTNVNDVGPRVSLANVAIAPISEHQTFSTRVKVADIVVHDDGLGTNALTLAGENAALFEIHDGDLYLKAGTTLDYETLAHLTVTVNVADAALPGHSAEGARYLVSVADENEAPELSLENTVTSLPENTSTSLRVFLADIVVDDDALGFNELALSGTDAEHFEIIGRQLFLKGGTALDHETQASYSVTVGVDDADLSGGAEDTLGYVLTVSDATLAAVNDALRVENTFREEPVILSPLANDFFDGSGTLRIISVTGALHGTATVVDNSGNSSHDQISYTPEAGFTGTETLTYIVEDAEENQSTATITLTVAAAANANRAPLAPQIRLSTPAETDLEFTLLPHVLDADGDEVTLVSFAMPVHGDITSVTDSNGVTTYTYTPDEGFTGTETLSYTVEDEYGAQATASVIIAVNNTRAVAVADSYRVEENTTLTASSTSRASGLRSVLVNDLDVDGQTLTATLVADAQHGTLTLNANGTFTYTPDEDYVGSDSFTYKANDGFQDSTVQTVTITVFAEDLGTGADNGVVPQDVPDPHDEENESNTEIIILLGEDALDPTRGFEPPPSSGNGTDTDTIDDTVETTDEDDVDHSSDRDISISREFDANVYLDGSWTYWETYFASYSIVTTSSDGSLVTVTGTYQYLVSAAGDDSYSTFTLTATNTVTSTGSFTSDWNQDGQTGSVDYDWTQQNSTTLSVSNYTNFDTGLAWGMKSETQTQSQTYVGLGTYSYGINGGEVTGTITSSGAQSGGTTLNSVYAGGPAGWVLSGGGTSWSLGNDNSTRSGGGDYLLTSSADGVTTSTEGHLGEYGHDASVNALSSHYALDGNGWHMLGGAGLSTSHGGSTQDTNYTGAYSHTIEGGVVNGTFSGHSRDTTGYLSTITTTGTGGVWSNIGTASQSGDGESGYESNGEGEYSLTRDDVENLTVNAEGTVKEHSADNSNYNFTSGYTLTSGNWLLTSGGGTSHGDGDSWSEITEPKPQGDGNYTREIKNEAGQNEGTVEGWTSAHSKEESDYFWDVNSSVVSGAWVESGDYLSHNNGNRDNAYNGKGTYSRQRTLEDGTQVQFSGILEESGSTHDEYDSSSIGMLVAGEWVQTAGSGTATGYGNSFFKQDSNDQPYDPETEAPPTSNDTYTRTITDGAVHGYATESVTDNNWYDYSITNTWITGDWVSTGTRNDNHTWVNKASYWSDDDLSDAVKNDNNNDAYDTHLVYDVVESGEQNSDGRSKMTSVLDSAGEWQKYSGWDFSKGNGKFESISTGTGSYDQQVPGGTIHGADIFVQTTDNSSYNYELYLYYGLKESDPPGTTRYAWEAESFRDDTEHQSYDYQNPYYDLESEDPPPENPSGAITLEQSITDGPTVLATGTAQQYKYDSSVSDRKFKSGWDVANEKWVLASGEGTGSGSGGTSYIANLSGSDADFQVGTGTVNAVLTVYDEQTASYSYSTKFLVVADPGDTSATPRKVWKTTGDRTEDSTTILNKSVTGTGTYVIPPPEDEDSYLAENGNVSIDFAENAKTVGHTKLKLNHLQLSDETPPPTWVAVEGKVNREDTGKHLTTYSRSESDPVELKDEDLEYDNVKLTRLLRFGVEEYSSKTEKHLLPETVVPGVELDEENYSLPTGIGFTRSITTHATTLEGELEKTVQRDGFEFPALSHIKLTDSSSSTETISTVLDEEGEPEEVSRKISDVSTSSVEAWVEKKDYAYSRSMGGGLTGTVSGKLNLETRSKLTSSFQYDYELKEGETTPTQSGSGSVTAEFKDHFDYESGQNSGYFTRSIFSHSDGTNKLMSGQAFERGLVDANSKIEVEYTLDVPNDLWKVTSGSGESHSKAAYHDEMSGQGNYSHVGAPVYHIGAYGYATTAPPGWSEPISENLDPNRPMDNGFSLESSLVLVSTTTYTGTVIESRKRDWGHQYDTSTTLVDGEWVNTGTGHTFLKGNFDFHSDRTVGETRNWSGPASITGGQATGSITWSNTENTDSKWHKDYDFRQDYTLAENTTTGANFWLKTTLTEKYHASATSTLDFDFAANWDYHYANSTTADWDTTGYHYTGTGVANRDETFTSHFDIDSKVTTYNTSGGVAGVTGTQTWDKSASGTLTRDFDVGSALERNYQGGYTELYQYNTQESVGTETFTLTGSWSKNLSTNVTTQISNSITTGGSHSLDITYEEWVGDPEDWGYLEIDEPYNDTYTYSSTGSILTSSSTPGVAYGTYSWTTLYQEHGYNPLNLGTMEVTQQGVLPGVTGWNVGGQSDPEGFGHEEPEATADENAEEEGTYFSGLCLADVYEGVYFLAHFEEISSRISADTLRMGGHYANKSIESFGEWMDDQLGLSGMTGVNAMIGAIYGSLIESATGTIASAIDWRGTIRSTVDTAIEDYLTYSDPSVGGNLLTGLAGVTRINRLAEGIEGADIATAQELNWDQRFDRSVEGIGGALNTFSALGGAYVGGAGLVNTAKGHFGRAVPTFGRNTLSAAEVPDGHIPKVIQSGGHTISPRTARILNKTFNKKLHYRDWGRALEELKSSNTLPPDFHGLIDDVANYLDRSHTIIDNISDYL